jgi:hypothetical protein
MHVHAGLATGLLAYLMWLILHFFHVTLAQIFADKPIGQALGYLA